MAPNSAHPLCARAAAGLSRGASERTDTLGIVAPPSALPGAAPCASPP
jgi:hypothetical protein